MKKIFFLLCLFALNSSFAAHPVVTMETSHGAIEIELFEDKAPNTVANFLKYVDDKFYDGTIFHRVINGFMIQGGGFTQNMAEKSTRAPIKNEATNGLSNDVGTLAMARTNDPHSATAQFFINVGDNSSLNHTGQNPSGWGYAVFGKVTQGMHVVNRIKMVKTGNINGYSDVPMDAVIIKSARRKDAAPVKVEVKAEKKVKKKSKTSTKTL
jgi:cyclophilin family peptidyl-prolyl cis-trans isomerase